MLHSPKVSTTVSKQPSGNPIDSACMGKKWAWRPSGDLDLKKKKKKITLHVLGGCLLYS